MSELEANSTQNVEVRATDDALQCRHVFPSHWGARCCLAEGHLAPHAPSFALSDPAQTSFRESLARPIGLYMPPPPLLRTPDGIPDGWHVYVEDGVPVLARREAALTPGSLPVGEVAGVEA